MPCERTSMFCSMYKQNLRKNITVFVKKKYAGFYVDQKYQRFKGGLNSLGDRMVLTAILKITVPHTPYV